MRQYSIDQVEFTWAGLDFKEGIAEGTFLQEAKTSPRWIKKATGVGKVVRVFNPDRSGTLTITVDQESKLHQQLLVIMLADDVGRNQVFPGLMTDKSSNAVNVYQNMFIENDPDESRATESGTFAWVMGFEAKLPTPNPGDDNIVGT